MAVHIMLEPPMARSVDRIVARLKLDRKLGYSRKRYIEECIIRCIAMDYATCFPNDDISDISDKATLEPA